MVAFILVGFLFIGVAGLLVIRVGQHRLDRAARAAGPQAPRPASRQVDLRLVYRP